jgi:branched-subunit amino acid transport protein
MNPLLIILGMALVTFSVRYLPLTASGRIPLPESLRKSLEFVPIAVLAAIIVPTVVFPGGDHLELTWQNPYLVASLAAGIISWRTKNLLMTILLGMGVFLIWMWLVVPAFLA